MTGCSINPCNTSVTTITVKVRNKMMSRWGKGAPFAHCQRNGERSRKRDDAPHTREGKGKRPLPRAASGSRLVSAGEKGAEHNSGKGPGKARENDDSADDGCGKRRGRKASNPRCSRAAAGLQAGHEKHQAFDEIDDEFQKNTPCSRSAALMKRGPFQLM